MLQVFTKLADWLTYSVFGMEAGSHLAESVHFFIEDVSKIYALLLVLIYVIGFLRAGLNTEKIRTHLEGKHRFIGYLLAAAFGAVTPFCSCSSIPLFLAFTQARIPMGITMAFLVTSPMINEVAVVLLGGTLGVPFTAVYISLGILSGVLAGMFFDFIKADRHLKPIEHKEVSDDMKERLEKAAHYKPNRQERHQYAVNEFKSVFSKIWLWVIIGVGAGAALHGFVPESVITDNLGDGQWWSVPSAVLLGIPLYANASGVIPAIESLLDKGLPVGTALAFMMSVVAASLPEFMLLKQVMKPRLLVMFFLTLLVLFSSAGWIFNLIW
ncbi:permease [Pontiella sp.]|uniref:permease n=1 Tax=Pontiella sp. TaxID=2837462 RepID=UPI003568371B